MVWRGCTDQLNQKKAAAIRTSWNEKSHSIAMTTCYLHYDFSRIIKKLAELTACRPIVQVKSMKTWSTDDTLFFKKFHAILYF